MLRGDACLAEPAFADAYAWLAAEMDRRVSTTGPGMLWAWARIGRRQLVSNVRRARGDVLLTVDVSAERALVHSYDDWHAVLNRALLVPARRRETAEQWWARAEQIIDEFEARVDAGGHRQLSLGEWPKELRAELEASWTAIFDPGTWEPGAHLQAMLHELRAEDVVAAARIR